MGWRKGNDKYYIQHTDGSVINKWFDGDIWKYELWFKYDKEPIGSHFNNADEAKEEYERLIDERTT